MNSERVEKTTLGGGCFWCLEAVFRRLRGVRTVLSGYSGGSVRNPTYREVCSGLTGHAEVVQIEFHPDEITYRDLLEVFFSVHDPTTLNRQGADIGTQYRSVIFFHDSGQKAAAEKLIQHLTSQNLFPDPIVTAVEPLEAFYPAEDYHQDYYERNSNQPYCVVAVRPKLTKLDQKFSARLKARRPPS